MLDPLTMGHDAQSIPLESGAMTQAPLVPNPTQPKRHVCRLCPSLRQEPIATCALGCVQPPGRQSAQALRVHRGVPNAPPAWRLGPIGCSLPICPHQQWSPQWKHSQSTVPVLQCRTVQSTMNSIPRYNETLINFNYS